MRITEYSKIKIVGTDALIREYKLSRSQLFLFSGLVLTILVGVIAPAGALLTGFTGPESIIFVAVSIMCYILIIILTRLFIAGWSATVPVLATFNMSIPITQYAGTIRVEFMIVDVFLISLGLFAIVNGVDSGHTHVRAIYRLTVLFAVLALFIGVVTWIGGYPLTGLWFGINQIRYLLIIFVGGTITYRYGFRYLLMLLMSVFSLHIIYAIVESILGKSLGLGYFGDVHAGAGPPLGSSSISAITFHSGLYPGGFFGTSRALLAVLCLIFPSALYWLYHNQRSLPAFFTVIGTLLLVNISQSDTGTVVLFISVVAVVATVTLYQHGIVQKLSVAQAFMISVAVGSISSAFAWNVLTSGIFSNTAVRVEQYRIAWKMFLDNPLLGIGGQNFAFLVEKLMLSGEITEVPGIHNTFLAYLAELGIIGFVIYTLVTAMVYWKLLSGYLSNWAAAAECGALAVGFVAFHIYSSFTLIYQRPPVMMIYWLLTGGVVVYITENNIS